MRVISVGNLASIGILLLTGALAGPASAEPGHCDYELYSKALDRRLKVCQAVEDSADCGKLMTQTYDESMAHAVGNEAGGVNFEKGNCSVEAVVGICTLSHTEIYFYEGDAGDLAAGCDRIKGRWNPRRFDHGR